MASPRGGGDTKSTGASPLWSSAAACSGLACLAAGGWTSYHFIASWVMQLTRGNMRWRTTCSRKNCKPGSSADCSSATTPDQHSSVPCSSELKMLQGHAFQYHTFEAQLKLLESQVKRPHDYRKDTTWPHSCSCLSCYLTKSLEPPLLVEATLGWPSNESSPQLTKFLPTLGWGPSSV